MGPEPRGAPSIEAFLRRLRELGYVYGEHFVTEARGGENSPERFPGLAAELVRLTVDVIVASGPTLFALKKATSTIPCVMAAAQDPVDEGLVRSLGRPGGNFTGLSLQTVETFGKRLELLKELVPSSAPVGVLWDQTTFNLRSWAVAEAAARQRGWKLLSFELRSANEIEGAFKAASKRGREHSWYSRGDCSSAAPGAWQILPPKAGFRPCMRFGTMSRPAG